MTETACIFRVAGTLFVSPLHFVSEVIEVPAVAVDKLAPTGVVGAVNVRGSVACVLDIGSAFTLGESSGTLGIVFKCGSRIVLVPIDEVLDVARLDLSTPRALPESVPEGLRAACLGLVPTDFGWACSLDITKAVLA